MTCTGQPLCTPDIKRCCLILLIIHTFFSVCEQGSFGLNCAQTCACVPGNIKSCSNVDGKCDCKDGWEGTTCNLNINECTRNTFQCPDQSTCEDNDGSYVCNCNQGYKKDSNNQNCIGKCFIYHNQYTN